jgi:hypothetical protein
MSIIWQNYLIINTINPYIKNYIIYLMSLKLYNYRVKISSCIILSSKFIYTKTFTEMIGKCGKNRQDLWEYKGYLCQLTF